ncbi:MAG: methyl-accepting chemotaxis protein [Candidatus Omnitrophica bacterium]|nr:methyl-accepting chemotaxis protein [Candidatus Omnitrophota bacterium]
MSKSHKMRTKYLMKGLFQYKFTFQVLLFILVVGAVSIYTVYHTSFRFLASRLQGIYPQGELLYMLKTANMILMQRLVFLIPVVIIFGILFSHRVAGPSFHIARFLREVVAKGDFSKEIHLRKRDELKEIAAAINEMTLKLSAVIGSGRKSAELIKVELERLEKDFGSGKNPAQLKTTLSKIRGDLKGIEALSDCKTRSA